MNKEARAEIDRLRSRTHPEIPDSPLMVLAKWVYLDAAAIAERAGSKGIADEIRERILFKKGEADEKV